MPTLTPKTTGTLTSLRRAAKDCRACPIWKNATQTVFGEGSSGATFLMVGEQAGDQEDRIGHPFVGPAGKLLDGALAEIGISRDDIYVTNIIKHFKFEQRGKRRLHKRANAAEIEICSQWLQGELNAVKARFVICLGALASRVMIGRDFKLQEQRGAWTKLDDRRWALATVHPSFVIRSRIGGDFDEAYAAFVDDLKRMKRPPK
jgi:DNA polymerase